MGVRHSSITLADAESALGHAAVASLMRAFNRVELAGFMSGPTFVRHVLGAAVSDMPTVIAQRITGALADGGAHPSARATIYTTSTKFSASDFIRAVAVLSHGSPNALARLAFHALLSEDETALKLGSAVRRLKFVSKSNADTQEGAFTVAARMMEAIFSTSLNSGSLPAAVAARAKSSLASLKTAAAVDGHWISAESRVALSNIECTEEEFVLYAVARTRGIAADAASRMSSSSSDDDSTALIGDAVAAVAGWSEEPFLCWLLGTVAAVHRIVSRCVENDTLARAASVAAALDTGDGTASFQPTMSTSRATTEQFTGPSLTEREKASLGTAFAAARKDPSGSGHFDAAALARLLRFQPEDVCVRVLMNSANDRGGVYSEAGELFDAIAVVLRGDEVARAKLFDSLVDDTRTYVQRLTEALRLEVGLPPPLAPLSPTEVSEGELIRSAWVEYAADAARPGDVWFVCASAWISEWAAITPGGSWALPAGEIGSFPRRDVVGPIPCSSLCAMPGVLRIDLTRGPTGDVTLVAPRAWKALAAFHAIDGVALPRAVIDTSALPPVLRSESSTFLELYPLRIQVERARPGAFAVGITCRGKLATALALGPSSGPAIASGVLESLPGSQSSSAGSSAGFTRTSASFVLVSRATRAASLRDAIADALGVRAVRVRLWRYVKSAAAAVAATTWAPLGAAGAAATAALGRGGVFPYLPLVGTGSFSPGSHGAPWEWTSPDSAIAWGGAVDPKSLEGGKWAHAWLPPHLTRGSKVLVDVSSVSGRFDVLGVDDDTETQQKETKEATAWAAIRAAQAGQTALPSAPLSDAVAVVAARQRAAASVERPNIALARAPLFGITNLGHSCFLNAPLQCVLSLPLISQYFSSGAWARDIRLGQSLSISAATALTVAATQIAVPRFGEEAGVLTPTALRNALNSAGGLSIDEQHDAEEALSVLFSRLSEELNVASPNAPHAAAPTAARTEQERAAAHYASCNAAEHSLIRTLTTGQLRSEVACTHCGDKSVSFEAFSLLSLPLPVCRNMDVTVIVAALAGARARPQQLVVSMPRSATVGELCRAISLRVGSSGLPALSLLRVLGTLPLDGGSASGSATRALCSQATLESAFDETGTHTVGPLVTLAAFPLDFAERRAIAVLVSHSTRAHVGARAAPGTPPVALDDEDEPHPSDVEGAVGAAGATAWASPPAGSIPPALFNNPDCYLLSPWARSPLPGPPVLLTLDPHATSSADLYLLVARSVARWLRAAPRFPESAAACDLSPAFVRPGAWTAVEVRAAWGFVLRRSVRAEGGWANGCPICEWPRGCNGCVLLPTLDSLESQCVGAVAAATSSIALAKAVVAVGDGSAADAAIDSPWLSFIAEHDNAIVAQAWDGVEATAVTHVPNAVPAVRVASRNGGASLDECLRSFAEPQALDANRECTACSFAPRTTENDDGVSSSASASQPSSPGFAPSRRAFAFPLPRPPPLLRSAQQRLQVYSLPPILVIQLKRFSFGGHGRKTSAPVRIPGVKRSEPLCMREHISGGGEGGACAPLLSRSEVHYVLYGVVNHYGSIEAGHFTAAVRSPSLGADGTGEWLATNDHIVTRITDSDVIIPASSYILFFVRVDVDVSWQAAMRDSRGGAPSSSGSSRPAAMDCGCVPRRPDSPFDKPLTLGAIWPRSSSGTPRSTAAVAIALSALVEAATPPPPTAKFPMGNLFPTVPNCTIA